MYISKTEFPELWALAKIGGYTGQRLEAQVFNGEMRLHSYWDGGERDYFTFIKLDTKEITEIPQNGTMFDGKNYGISALPQGVALVRNHCGRFAHCIIYFNSADITPLLDKPKADLTTDELIVLHFTASYKSSYGGVSNLRFHEAHKETKILLEAWNAAKASLQGKKLLNKAGAITAEGRNIVQNTRQQIREHVKFLP